jgi:predicted permease
MEVEGQPKLDDSAMVGWRFITPEYFSALEIPILRGRGFEESDRKSSDNVIVINESLARSLFPDKNPLSQRIKRGSAWYSVIGVSGDAKNSALADPVHPEYYIVRKYAGVEDTQGGNFIIRTSTDAKALAEQVRAQIAASDPTLPVTIETLNQRAARLAEQPRFNAVLLGLFAFIGLSLSAIGLYGLIAFLVTERTQEIGVRMAIGATPRDVMVLILTHAAGWTIAGTAWGVLGSLYMTRYLRGLLFEIAPGDSRTFGISCSVLLAVAMIAAWIPSRQATRIDPMMALRQE